MKRAESPQGGGASWESRRALTVVLLTVALDAMGIGLICPILPEIMRQLAGHAAIAGTYGLLLTLYALMQFLFAPLLGALSDRFGRRPILVLSLVGSVLYLCITALAANVATMFIGRALAGASGANAAVASACLADITTPEQRAQRYGWMNACFGIGFVLGPALGGLLGIYGFRLPFFVAAALAAINALLAMTLLPETHRLEQRRPIEPRQLSPLGALRALENATTSTLRPTLIMYVLAQLIAQFAIVLWVIFLHDRFGWGPWMVGLSIALYGLIHACFQALLTAPLLRLLGERGTLALGILSDALGYLILSVAAQGWWVFADMPPLCLGSVTIPTLQAMLSRSVDEQRQGALQGALSSLTSLMGVIAPLAVTTLYAALLPHWSGGVWCIAALLYLPCIPLLRRVSLRGAET